MPKPRPITSIDILKFIDGEFRTAARDVLELHGLETVERVERFQCLRVVHQGNFLFSFKENGSKFRAGDYVLLNADIPEMKGDMIGGGDKLVIDRVDDEKREVSLVDPYNFWGNTYTPESDEHCVIDLRPVSRFPLYTYPAWASGYLSTETEPGPFIQRILSGEYNGGAVEGRFPKPSDILLTGQKKAFLHAMRNRLSLIQGPPGTGKTFLIAHIVEALVGMGLRVFICAFSHRAINNALNACVRETSLKSVAKIGGVYANDGLDEAVQNDKACHVIGMTAFEAFKSRAGRIREALKKGEYTRPEIPTVRDEAYWRELDRYTRAIFEAGISGVTPEFDVVVFDEASQLLMHHALMAMPCAKRYIFVGDHQQMPPVIQGYHRGNPVNQSVFSLLLNRYPDLNTLLVETRRMNQAITAFPSAEYYQNRLEPIPEVRKRTLDVRAMPRDRILSSIIDPDAPVVFAHVAHEDYTQESPEEARLVARIVFELVWKCGIDPKDGLCVVAAHRRQNNLIRASIASLLANRKRVRQSVVRRLLSPDLVVDTVERIQGQERDVVIVSLTASDETHIRTEKDFLMMPNRMNVSFTRPRSKLIVVGSKNLFRMVPADRDDQELDRVDGTDVMRSKGLMLANHFKRWYFHVKECQRIVDATELARKPV